MKSNDSYRYAVYFSGEPLGDFWRLGSQWLGRCATGLPVDNLPSILGLDPQVHQRMTTHPKRYGWHATLKAPFSLREEISFNDLDESMQKLANDLQIFQLPSLVVQKMKIFLALAPIESTQCCNVLKATASKCVTDLHPLTRPLNEGEIAYRRSAGLNALEETMMLKWGYPFVHELFEFHFTLSNGLDQYEEEEVKSLMDAAFNWFPDQSNVTFDRISLFVEDEKGNDFRLMKDYCISS
jgi:hypothetical protein